MSKDKLKGRIAVLGTGEVPTGWFPQRSAMDSAIEACAQAITDSGVNKNEIGAVIVVPPLGGACLSYQLTFGRLIEGLGLRGCNFTMQANAGGSSTMAALQTARGLISSGAAENVLVAHTQQWSNLSPEALVRFFQENAGQYEEWEFSYGMTYNAMVAMVAQRYMYETGTTPEQIASVVVSLRKWAALNPNCRFKKPVTLEDVMNSKMIASPLRMFECNVLSDGASAFVVTSAEAAQNTTDKPVYILGEGHGGATHFSMIQKPDKDFTRWGFDKAGKMALEKAGVELKDISIAQIYMAYPHFHLMVLEELGFCKRGEAGAFVMEGHTCPGGKLPMTTTGDAIGQGHTGTGVGMAVFVESVRQLREQCGERQVKGAEFILESSAGGAYMDSHVTILGKEIP